MYGKPYQKGNNFLGNVGNYLQSPQATQMFGQMADGRSFGGSYAGSLQYAQQMAEQEQQRKMQEQLFSMKVEDRGLNNQYTQARINHLGRQPQGNNASTNDIRNYEKYIELKKSDPAAAEQFLTMSNPLKYMQLNGGQAVFGAGNPTAPTMLSTNETEVQAAAAKAFAEQQAKTLGENAAAEEIDAPTPGQLAVDNAFAQEYATFQAGGGYSDALKQLDQLKGVITSLDNDNVTGPIIGSTPEFILNKTNPKAVSTRESVEEVVQRNLRLILGAQFTEEEGKRLISRAYNPNLEESENKERVQRLYSQMEEALKAKQSAAQYFEENGTLKGWKGKLFTPSDFNIDGYDKTSMKSKYGLN